MPEWNSAGGGTVCGICEVLAWSRESFWLGNGLSTEFGNCQDARQSNMSFVFNVLSELESKNKTA